MFVVKPRSETDIVREQENRRTELLLRIDSVALRFSPLREGSFYVVPI